MSDELVNFIIATSNSVREVRKTKLQEAKKHFKKLFKKLNLEDVRKEISKLESIAPKWLDKEFKISYSKRKKSKAFGALSFRIFSS